MLPLSEIRELSATVNGDWQSPVADAIAAAWDVPPGAARYWRSSATHVFVVAEQGVRRWLRFTPLGHASATRLRTGLALSRRWADLGATQPIPTVDGGLSAVIDTSAGQVLAVLTADAPGVAVTTDADDDLPVISTDQVQRWGSALAAIHASSVVPATDLVRLMTPPQNPALSDLIEMLEARLAAAPACDRGLIHGDFEADNLRFTEHGLSFFDADEGGHDLFLMDIALATRDLDEPQVARFLDGYGAVRTLPPEGSSMLADCRALAAARLAADVSAAIDLTPTDDDPAWLVDLHRDLTSFVTDQLEVATDVAA